VVTGDANENRPHNVITISSSSKRTVGVHRLDRRFLLVSDSLPDGRLVFEAAGGFMVATSPRNNGFVFRPAPTGDYGYFSITDQDIVIYPGNVARHRIIVSSDAGRTWRTIDFKGRGWDAP
jgi:hypothetical protein